MFFFFLVVHFFSQRRVILFFTSSTVMMMVLLSWRLLSLQKLSCCVSVGPVVSLFSLRALLSVTKWCSLPIMTLPFRPFWPLPALQRKNRYLFIYFCKLFQQWCDQFVDLLSEQLNEDKWSNFKVDEKGLFVFFLNLLYKGTSKNDIEDDVETESEEFSTRFWVNFFLWIHLFPKFVCFHFFFLIL